MGPCPRESCISPYRLEALRLHQKIISEERVTVKMFFEIGKSEGRKCRKMWEITFRKTLRMERGIAENDRTVQETPVENCISQYFPVYSYISCIFPIFSGIFLYFQMRG